MALKDSQKSQYSNNKEAEVFNFSIIKKYEINFYTQSWSLSGVNYLILKGSFGLLFNWKTYRPIRNNITNFIRAKNKSFNSPASEINEAI